MTALSRPLMRRGSREDTVGTKCIDPTYARLNLKGMRVQVQNGSYYTFISCYCSYYTTNRTSRSRLINSQHQYILTAVITHPIFFLLVAEIAMIDMIEMSIKRSRKILKPYLLLVRSKDTNVWYGKYSRSSVFCCRTVWIWTAQHHLPEE
jgi:hypothetical protein